MDYIPPKTVSAFKGRPTIAMITLFEPTDRYIMWVIANDKSAYNIKFWIQFKDTVPEINDANSNFGEARKMLDSLRNRKMIYQDQNGDWHITKKGNIIRFITHPFFPLIAILFSATVAYSIFLLNKYCD